jgi:ABC-type antimicrobial peptide transport system permease subunit
MKSFWSLIPRSLSKNKKRVFFIAVGIMLSVSLIVSLSIMIETFKKIAYPLAIDSAGGIHDASFYTSDKKALKELENDPVINKKTITLPLGVYKIPSSKYSLEISGCDTNISEFLNLKLLEGEYPQNNNEIVIEEWILNSMSKKYQIGDKVKLYTSLEYRDLNGKLQILNKEHEFILVGIFQHKVTSKVAQNTATAYVPRKYAEDIFLKYQIEYKGYLTINSKYTIMDGLSLLTLTSEYEHVFFKVNSQKSNMIEVFKLINFVSIILYIIISIVASIIIYNIFNVSVTERIREFGMLRALGASPGEINLLVLGEGLTLGGIFIPLGIVFGNFLVKGIIFSVSNYTEFGGIINIPLQGIIASFVVGFLTIIMGVYFPARKASTISPMEAINSNNNLDLKGKRIKKTLKSKKFFGVNLSFTTEMAYLNLNRSRRRFLTTVVSLSISIIMFVLVNYVISNLDTAESIKNSMGGDFILSLKTTDPNYVITDKDIHEIESIKGIDKIKILKEAGTSLQVPDEKVTDEGISFLTKESKKSLNAASNFKAKIYTFNSKIFGYTEEDLKELNKYILEGKIDIKEMSENPIVLLAQNLNYSNYTKLNVGDSIKLSYVYYDEKGNFVNYRDGTFTIGALLKENALKSSLSNFVILNENICEKYLNIKGYQNVKVILDDNANYDEVEKTLKAKLNSNRNINMVSLKEEIELAKKKYETLSLTLYGLIIIVAIVSIVNLINIMSMNILLRKKEIGMFRALGFGEDEVKKMIWTEGLFYGITSAFWGTTIGTILTFIIFLVTRKILANGMHWRFSPIIITSVFFITILICLLASINASRKAFSSSIVESIRGLE